MADTDTETLPNGTGALSNEEEDERLKQRPADIDADVREMERRKRVEALMSSKLFREELERVLDQQLHEGNDAPLLQRIREMVGGRLHTGSLRGPTCVLPINDIRGIEGIGYEKGEKILRCKLAAVYRLVDLFGWTQTGITGQITARLNTAVEQVLTTPRGLLPHEVTASSLVKVDMQGVVQDQGTTNFPVNVDGFSLHASVHAARPDVRCVLHVRSPAALAVSAMRRGLLPLCNEAALLGDVAYHRVPHGILDNEECDKLVRALGPHAKVLMLTSAGALCCGATLEEAFHQARNLTAACDVQLRMAALPLDELYLIDEDTRKQMYEWSRKPPADASKWRVGGEEFEALMRMLDNAGFRTGYIYRHPLIKNDVPKPKNDVEVPPAVSSLGYLLEEEELYKQGLWKKGQGKTGERTRWLNSPNVYQKVEVLETGTTDPKKITKWVDANNEEWVQDGSPAHTGTPVKIDTLQFVPKNTNPKEFKQLQQQIKDYRRADKISAGPQSHILEGVTWDEASKLVGEDAVNTHTGDHVVLMGAASKGIIQRGYQHNATVYSAPYARNPFDQVTDTDIDEYKRDVERKRRGNDYDTDLSESEAISAAQITSPASAPSETEEESRDEHRVLRIETKQAPVRSQPEVVLSDVDTTDFLDAERAHADRTKAPPRDPNLLSDDEVFLDSAASTGTSSVTSPIQGPVVVRAQHTAVHQTVVRGRDPNLLSDDEVFLDSPASSATSRVTSPTPVVVRVQHPAVQRVFRGNPTPEDIVLKEALSTNKRNVHDYSRSANFDNVVKVYQSPEKDYKKHPKCKLSLNPKLETEKDNVGHASSCSSLYSIPSIEWDGKCRSEYGFRTRSLPRKKPETVNTLFRTRSHSGFTNSFVKDPEPMHYHLPRCRSCGAANNTYVWELSKDDKSVHKAKIQSSVYYSVDNIPQKGFEEAKLVSNIVKVKEKIVPVFNVAKNDTEFVDSQEFNEDNYLGDIGDSFSSDNRTVIENVARNTEKNVVGPKDQDKQTDKEDGIYRADCVQIESMEYLNKTIESTEGEYHSFTDEDFEEAYESPVKYLVEKDIRDYSVPINFYCEDYQKESPKKSPFKVPKTNVLEPILEESKSSYGDESSNQSHYENKMDKKDSDAEFVVQDVMDNIFHTVITTVQLKIEMSSNSSQKNTSELLKTKYLHAETYSATEEGSDMINNDVKSLFTDVVETAIDVYKTDELADDDMEQEGVIECVYENIYEFLTSDANSSEPILRQNRVHSSVEYSTVSSGYAIVSFDSTAEFEIYEVVTELLSSILNNIHFDCIHDFFNIEKRHIHTPFDEMSCAELDIEKVNKKETKEDFNEIDHIEECFSITKLIQDIEENVNINHTILTESSDSEKTQANKIVEGILYYLFDRVLFMSAHKNRGIRKKNKNVITVVDSEDILYTAANLWRTLAISENTNYEEAEIENNNLINNQELLNTEVLHKNTTALETCLNDEVFPKDTLTCSNSKTFINSMNFTLNNAVNKEIKEDTHDLCQVTKAIYMDDLNDEYVDAYNYKENRTENSVQIAEEFIYEIVNNITEIRIENNYLGIINKKDAEVNDSLNDTYVLAKDDMNIAFLEEQEITNESSFKLNDVFESSLYEKDDSILGSPFIKKAPLISMSQTEHSGGIKYWISFDENFEQNENLTPRTIRQYPSFVSIDVDKHHPNKNNDDLASSSNDYKDCESIDLNESRLSKGMLESIQLPQKKPIYELHSKPSQREHTLNGDHSDAHQSTFSHSSKEGSPSKEVSTEDSPKKDKKKKKGLRTPSFLKKKKEKKKEKSSTPQPA